jgi:hypothetical protein
VSSYMDRYLDWLESTTPAERLAGPVAEPGGGPAVDDPDPDWLYDSDGHPVEHVGPGEGA